MILNLGQGQFDQNNADFPDNCGSKQVINFRLSEPMLQCLLTLHVVTEPFIYDIYETK